MALHKFLDALDESLDRDKNKMSYDSIKELFFEDRLVNRYKQKYDEIVFDYKQTGGGKHIKINHDKFLKLSDNDIYFKKITDAHNLLYKLTRELELQPRRLNILPKYLIVPNIYDTYILHRHLLKKIPEYLNFKRDNIFINKLTKIKNSTIVIYTDLLSFRELNDDIDNVINYINDIILNLNDGGTIILFTQLLLSNKKYYEFFINICSKFNKISIAFSLHPLRQSLSCEIKLENYNPTITNNIDIERLMNFYKEINQFILEESDIDINLMKVKYHDNFMYELIINKLFQ
jgi:hypothetical protein